MTTQTNRPKYNRCDICGRNAHKVAVRERIFERTDTFNPVTKTYYRPTGRTHVVGYCTSCFASHLDRGNITGQVLYDIRGAHARKLHPVPTPKSAIDETREVLASAADKIVNGRRVWASCGHPAELDINNDCYTCHQAVA